MSRIFCIAWVLFIAVCSCRAQKPSGNKDNTFPSAWTGNWKGELKWHRTGNDTVQPVKMELRIQPADTAGHYTWHLIYGEGSKDSRPYILKPSGKSKDHWLLDERNGIFIDHYYVAGRLSCVFTVMNSTIINNTWLQGDKLIIEFYSISVKPVSTTGNNTEESPIVNSFGVRSYQRAELTR